MERLIEGPAAAWLASHRKLLNDRFDDAARRYPRLDGDAVAEALRALLPALAGPEEGASALLSSVFDLVLLHAGRQTLHRKPAVARLLLQAFPKLRAKLLQQPQSLPSELSNAVENLGTKGSAFVDAIVDVAARVEAAADLRKAGVVLAWTLGDPRYREAALADAETLPPGLVLWLLGLSDWPDLLAPVALASLRGNAWVHPRSRVTPEWIDACAVEDGRERAIAALVAPMIAPVADFIDGGRVGEFVGFGGAFPRPPLLLDRATDHELYVRSAGLDYVVAADLFGWVCKRDVPSPWPIRTPYSPPRTAKQVDVPAGELCVRSGGWLQRDGQRVRKTWLSNATSFVACGVAIATTHADSFRIRISVPALPLRWPS